MGAPINLRNGPESGGHLIFLERLGILMFWVFDIDIAHINIQVRIAINKTFVFLKILNKFKKMP